MLPRRILVFSLAVAFIGVGWLPLLLGQTAQDAALQLVEKRAVRFLEAISSGKSASAFQELLAGSRLAGQTEAVQTLVEQTDQLVAHYGGYRGVERIAQAVLGQDLVVVRYLYKCENYPVVWTFAFYRTPSTGAAFEGDTWRVVSVRFDTNLDKLLP